MREPFLKSLLRRIEADARHRAAAGTRINSAEGPALPSRPTAHPGDSRGILLGSFHLLNPVPPHDYEITKGARGQPAIPGSQAIPASPKTVNR